MPFQTSPASTSPAVSLSPPMPSSAYSSPTDLLSGGCHRDFLAQLRKKSQQCVTSSSAIVEPVVDPGAGLDARPPNTPSVHPSVLLASYPLYHVPQDHQASSPSSSLSLPQGPNVSAHTQQLVPLLTALPQATLNTAFMGTAIAVAPRILITAAHHYSSQRDSISGFHVRLPSRLHVEHYLRRTLHAKGNASPPLSSAVDPSSATVLIRVLYAQKKLDLDMCVMWLEESVPFYLGPQQFRSLQPYGVRIGGGRAKGEVGMSSSLETSSDAMMMGISESDSTATSPASAGLSESGQQQIINLVDEAGDASREALPPPRAAASKPMLHPPLTVVPGPQSAIRATTAYYHPQKAHDYLAGAVAAYEACVRRADAEVAKHHAAFKAIGLASGGGRSSGRAVTVRKAVSGRGGKRVATPKDAPSSIIANDAVLGGGGGGGDVQLVADTQLTSSQQHPLPPQSSYQQQRWHCTLLDDLSPPAPSSCRGLGPILRVIALLECKCECNSHMVVGSGNLAQYLSQWHLAGEPSASTAPNQGTVASEDNEDELPHAQTSNSTILLFSLVSPPTECINDGPPPLSIALTPMALRDYLLRANPHLISNGARTDDPLCSAHSNPAAASGWEARLAAALCRETNIVASTGTIVEAIGRGQGRAPHACVVRGTITTNGSSGAPVVDARGGCVLLGMHIASNKSKSHHHRGDGNGGGGGALSTTRTSEFVMASVLVLALRIMEVYLHPQNPGLQ